MSHALTTVEGGPVNARPRAPRSIRSVPAAALFAAGQALLPVLEAGRPLDAAALRGAMTRAFGAIDAEGAWVWKDAYEAAEAAVVLFLKRYGRAMRRRAGDGGPPAMLVLLQKLAVPGALPHEAIRVPDPPPAVLHAPGPRLRGLAGGRHPVRRRRARTQRRNRDPRRHGRVRPRGQGRRRSPPERDRRDTGRPPGPALPQGHGDRVQRRSHRRPSPGRPSDRGPHESAVLRKPGSERRIRHDADLRHLRSAFAMLGPGGRLVAVTSAGCMPGDRAWTDAFERLDPPARVVFSMAIHGRAYARRGTAFDTRLTVLDRSGDGEHAAIDPAARADSSAELLEAVMARRSGASRHRRRRGSRTQPLRSGTSSATRPRSRRKSARPRPGPPAGRRRHKAGGNDWGPVSELAYDAAPVSGDAPADSGTAAGPYAAWKPGVVHVRDAVVHPTPLVQSAAMAAVPHPVPSYHPMLPERVVTDGLLSDAQIESVVLAGEAYDRHLPARYRIGAEWETVRRCNDDDGDGDATTDDGEVLSQPVRFRRGWMLGDGTGCGKGRQVAGILLDNRLRGRKRALWLSQSDKLVEDARRDWIALGGSGDDVIPLGKFRQGVEIPHEEGILFATYATLRSPARQGKASRLEQIVSWLAGGAEEEQRHAFDGVIVFDEAHAMANAAGSKGARGEVRPSAQGRAGLRLQNALPSARVLYVSATGATTVPGLAYAGRLGLWGAGETPFETRGDFVSAMEAGGVAAMEVVARDLKALGLYQARALAYGGVEIDILEHPLSPEQRRIYDAYAGAFKVIHANLQDALEATGVMQGDATLNRNAKSAALSAFEGAKQRFFGHLLTGMKCPSLIRAVEGDLEAGRSAVIQLVSTGEALMERRIAEIPSSEWDDLSVDLTPREYVLDFLAHAFPVQLQEPFTDEEGNLMSRPVFDTDGNPVLCREALAQRDALIGKLASLPPVQSALDRILHRFGHEAVAEVTGRSRRVLRITDGQGERLALRGRPASANLTETAAFMDGEKKILVFSMAGGTGRSYHADLACGNTARRIHYLLEPGWRADQAIQGLGRTHRTHQASAPLFRPVTTDVKGERRFIATIARRLDSLGAITRGQRDSQTAMAGDDAALFRESDNLESPYAKAALRRFYIALWRGRIPGWPLNRFEEATGLTLTWEGTLKDDLPPMPRFLNRLLALPIDEQNALFAELESLIAENVEQAIEAGTYDIGVETLQADSLAVAGRETLYTHPGTGAATDLVEILRRDRLEPTPADVALEIGAQDGDGRPALVVNSRSSRGAVVLSAPSRMLDDGGVQARVRLLRPTAREAMAGAELDASNWRRASEAEWRSRWEEEIAGLPTHTESRFWIVTGLLLPIWDRLGMENMRVRRLLTDAGEAMIGRVLDADQVRAARASFGLAGGPGMTALEAFESVMGRGACFGLANGWRLARRRIMGADRVEIEGPVDGDVAALKRMGCTMEIVSWRARVFAPDAGVLERVIERWPLAA